MLSRQYRIDDGIYIFDENLNGSSKDYDAFGLDLLFLNEESHFWFITRKEFIIKNLLKFINKNDSILDLGCGTGNIAKYFIDNGFLNVSVADMHLNGLKYARSNGISNCYKFDILKPPFEDEFDAICMFDVIEHIQEDKHVLDNVRKMLKNKGKIVITVPAHQWLWSKLDEISGHKRRYTKQQIKELMKNSGFTKLYVRYFFISLVSLLYLRKILMDKKSNLNLKNIEEIELKINPFLNQLLLSIVRLENLINPIIPNWFGGSLLVIGEKR